MSDEERISAMSESELAEAETRLQKRAALQSAMDMADLSVARFEPPSDAVDRQLNRNFDTGQRITRLRQLIRAEKAKRESA